MEINYKLTAVQSLYVFHDKILFTLISLKKISKVHNQPGDNFSLQNSLVEKNILRNRDCIVSNLVRDEHLINTYVNTVSR